MRDECVDSGTASRADCLLALCLCDVLTASASAGGLLLEAEDISVRVPPSEREQIAPVTVRLERDGQPVGTPCTVMARVAK